MKSALHCYYLLVRNQETNKFVSELLKFPPWKYPLVDVSSLFFVLQISDIATRGFFLYGGEPKIVSSTVTVASPTSPFQQTLPTGMPKIKPFSKTA